MTIKSRLFYNSGPRGKIFTSMLFVKSHMFGIVLRVSESGARGNWANVFSRDISGSKWFVFRFGVYCRKRDLIIDEYVSSGRSRR